MDFVQSFASEAQTGRSDVVESCIECGTDSKETVRSRFGGDFVRFENSQDQFGRERGEGCADAVRVKEGFWYIGIW